MSYEIEIKKIKHHLSYEKDYYQKVKQLDALRFFYTYVYGKNSLIVTLGINNFYEAYVKESLITFISHRFEEIVRS